MVACRIHEDILFEMFLKIGPGEDHFRVRCLVFQDKL